MPLWTLSQILDLTPEQQARRDEIFTAEKIKEQANVIIHYKKLLAEAEANKQAYDQLSKQYDELENMYNNLIEENSDYQKLLAELHKEKDITNEDRVNQAKRWFSGFHLDGSLLFQDLQWQRTNARINLYYRFKKDFPLVPSIDVSTFNYNNDQRTIAFGLMLTYNIF